MRTHNSWLKQLGLQWFIEHSTSHQLLRWVDSFTKMLIVFKGIREPFGVVLRNRQLLAAAKR